MKFLSTAKDLPLEARYDENNIEVCLPTGKTETIVGNDGEDEVQYEYERVLVKAATKGSIVNALIRERYTEADELALIRQRTAKKAEFTEYNDYCETCKALVKSAGYQ